MSGFVINLPDKEKKSLLPCIVTRYQHQPELPFLTKKSKNFPPLVITYHPALPSISKTIQKHHKVMVSQSKYLQRIFSRPSLVAYKRPKNLADLLIRAKVDNKRSEIKKNGFAH